MKPSVSIIIPNLHSPVIDRVLAAIRAQEFDLSQVEVLVVGQDGPGLVQTDRLISLISTQVPVPPAVARNIGVREARGEILCFLDADCVPDQHWLSVLLSRYNDESVQIVGGGVSFLKSGYWSLADNIATFYPYLSSSPPGTREQLPTLNLSIRRVVWDVVGPFDERYPRAAGEDADWSTRARLLGYTLYFEPRAFVVHLSARSNVKALWNHAMTFGLYSVKVDERYRDILKVPLFLRHWLIILLVSPAMAFGVTVQVFRNKHLWGYLHTFPAIYLAKLGWCWGASKRLRGQVSWYSHMSNSQELLKEVL